MKNLLKNCLLVFAASLFIKAGCSKSTEDVDAEHSLPTADQYVTWKFSSMQGSLQAPADSLFGYVNSGSTSIHGGTAYTATKPVYFSAAFNGPTTGSFNLNYINIMNNGHYYVSGSTPSQIKVTTYGKEGEYLIGSYTGTVKDSTNGQSSTVSYAISGNFRVKRLN